MVECVLEDVREDFDKEMEKSWIYQVIQEAWEIGVVSTGAPNLNHRR